MSVPCGERMNWPLRVKRTPCGVRSWKKPVPSIAKSSGSPVSRTEAGVRSVVVCAIVTPVPSGPMFSPVTVLWRSSSLKLRWLERSAL